MNQLGKDPAGMCRTIKTEGGRELRRALGSAPAWCHELSLLLVGLLSSLSWVQRDQYSTEGEQNNAAAP